MARATNMARAASMEVSGLDKITLRDQVGGTKNRVTLVKVEGAADLYDVFPDRTGVTQEGDEITAAALMQMQENIALAIMQLSSDSLTMKRLIDTLDIDGQRPEED